MKKGWRAGAVWMLAACIALSGCQKQPDGRDAQTRDAQTGGKGSSEGQTGGKGSSEGQTGGKESSEGQTGGKESSEGQTGGRQDSKEQTGEGQNSEKQNSGKQNNEKTADEQSGENGLQVKILENLGTDVDLLTDIYCRDGAIGDRISFFFARENAEDPNGSDVLIMNMSLTEEERWNGVRIMGDLPENETEYAVWTGASAEIRTEKGKRTYETELTYYWSDTDGARAEEKFPVTVIFPDAADRDPYVQIKGERRVAGKYHSLQHGYEMPDLFRRYLTQADLCSLSTDELRILRNSVYAAHGRAFEAEDLKKYFEKKTWYRETIRPDNFSETAFPDLEKKNIELIRRLEQLSDADRSRIDGQHYDPEKLPEAPYLKYLDMDGVVDLSVDDLEIGVYTEDKKNAVDCGLYWKIPGRIAHPVSLTEAQYRAVVGGNPVEVCLDEMTGETEMLEFFPDKGFVLYERGARPDMEDEKWYDHVTGKAELVGVSSNYRTGLYELWADSDDTLMKPVYQGDIYIMKGAVEGSYLTLETASRCQKPVFEEDVPSEGSQMGVFSPSIGGNHVRHNGRGYLTAVYYLGD